MSKERTYEIRRKEGDKDEYYNMVVGTEEDVIEYYKRIMNNDKQADQITREIIPELPHSKRAIRVGRLYIVQKDEDGSPRVIQYYAVDIDAVEKGKL